MNKKWTEEELSDTVNAYIDMWYKQQLNIPFIKKSYYKKLHEKYGRSISAFEYRMENISSIFLKLKSRGSKDSSLPIISEKKIQRYWKT